MPMNTGSIALILGYAYSVQVPSAQLASALTPAPTPSPLPPRPCPLFQLHMTGPACHNP